MTNISHDLG